MREGKTGFRFEHITKAAFLQMLLLSQYVCAILLPSSGDWRGTRILNSPDDLEEKTNSWQAN
jgi:hypothetical protein